MSTVKQINRRAAWESFFLLVSVCLVGFEAWHHLLGLTIFSGVITCGCAGGLYLNSANKVHAQIRQEQP